MRIFDRIASGETVFADDFMPIDAKAMSALRKVIHEFPRVIADEACEYLSYHKKDGWNPNSDFGEMNPPFEYVWVEWQSPRTKRFEGKIIDYGLTQFGVVLMRNPPEGHYKYSGTAWTTSPGNKPILQLPVTPCIDKSDLADFLINEEVVPQWLELHGYTDKNRMWGHFGSELLPLYLSFSWLNCATFELETQGPSKQLARKRQRKGQFAGLDYQRIVVGKKQRKRWESQSGQSWQRFHLVRGHYADYRKNGLFGKPELRGRYWVPSHGRGDKSLGTINHEYHVTSEATR